MIMIPLGRGLLPGEGPAEVRAGAAGGGGGAAGGGGARRGPPGDLLRLPVQRAPPARRALQRRQRARVAPRGSHLQDYTQSVNLFIIIIRNFTIIVSLSVSLVSVMSRFCLDSGKIFYDVGLDCMDGQVNPLSVKYRNSIPGVI